MLHFELADAVAESAAYSEEPFGIEEGTYPRQWVLVWKMAQTRLRSMTMLIEDFRERLYL